MLRLDPLLSIVFPIVAEITLRFILRIKAEPMLRPVLLVGAENHVALCSPHMQKPSSAIATDDMEHANDTYNASAKKKTLHSDISNQGSKCRLTGDWHLAQHASWPPLN